MIGAKNKKKMDRMAGIRQIVYMPCSMMLRMNLCTTPPCVELSWDYLYELNINYS